MSVVFEESDFSSKTGKYVLRQIDKKVSKSGDSMTRDLDMQTNFVHSTAIPNDNSDLVNKKYVDDEDNKKLSLTGGTMSGDITIGNNKIWSTSDPTGDKHLARKKYVDDADDLRLSLSGGRMTGDIIIDDHRIWSTSNPTHDRHLARKIYVDERDNLKLNLTGGTMGGDINMGNHHIIHASNYIPSSDRHGVNKKYVTNWSLPNLLTNLYTLQMDDKGIFEVKDDVNYIEYTGSNKKVEKLFNLSRHEDFNLTQTDSNKQSFFKKSTINNNFYCIQYLGSDSNNLHLMSNQDILSNQHLNFYFVYGLKSLNSSNNEVSLFKITSNETTSQSLPFDFGVSYRNSLLYITNSSRN